MKKVNENFGEFINHCFCHKVTEKENEQSSISRNDTVM